jgi:DMSO/TMAO reductase YedYZ molybdopterin-dependent catalytic subunit
MTIDRRRFLTRAAAASSALALAGCDRLSETPWWRAALGSAEAATKNVQRAILPRQNMAQEYPASAISKHFRANGSTSPGDGNPAYRALAAKDFADWKLEIRGLVERPAALSLADLRAMPPQTQITRHDCVEGWSCIGEWTGVRLSHVLDRVKLKPEAKYILFRCYDTLEQTLDNSGQYFETIDLEDARHPQTILAYGMNGKALPVPYGAPLRLRVERQLGYKMAKYLRRIEAIASFDKVGRGQGGFWEDRGYEWYAGI